MKEQQVQREIAVSYLQGELRAHKAEVAPKLDQELLELVRSRGALVEMEVL